MGISNNFRHQSLWIALAFGLGSLAGYSLRFTSGTENPQQKTAPPTAKTVPEVRQPEVRPSSQDAPKSPAEKYNLKQQVLIADREQLMKLPKTLVNRMASPLVFSSEEKCSFGSLLAYGIPVEAAKAVTEAVDSCVADLRALEVKNSRLVSAANGDQYFAIIPFEAEGAILRDKLAAVIKTTTSDFQDDRAELLMAALSKSPALRAFGAASSEIWFEETTDSNGVATWVATEKRTSGQITDTTRITGTAAKNRLADMLATQLPGR